MNVTNRTQIKRTNKIEDKYLQVSSSQDNMDGLKPERANPQKTDFEKNGFEVFSTPQNVLLEIEENFLFP